MPPFSAEAASLGVFRTVPGFYGARRGDCQEHRTEPDGLYSSSSLSRAAKSQDGRLWFRQQAHRARQRFHG